MVARHLPNPLEPATGTRPNRARTGGRFAPGAFALADSDLLHDAIAFFDRVSGAALRTIAPPHVIDAIVADLRAALAEHTGPNGVAVPAAAWVVTARNP